jgi:hypothetical protein
VSALPQVTGLFGEKVSKSCFSPNNSVYNEYMETTQNIITLTITLAGETREIDFEIWSEDRAVAKPNTFIARIGMGKKDHMVWSASAWKTNGVWKFNRNTVVLNKDATITGFAGTSTNMSNHICSLSGTKAGE